MVGGANYYQVLHGVRWEITEGRGMDGGMGHGGGRQLLPSLARRALGDYRGEGDGWRDGSWWGAPIITKSCTACAGRLPRGGGWMEGWVVVGGANYYQVLHGVRWEITEGRGMDGGMGGGG